MRAEVSDHVSFRRALASAILAAGIIAYISALAVVPANAEITNVSPQSATVVAGGGSVTVTVSSTGSLVGVSQHPNIVASPPQDSSAPFTFRFTPTLAAIPNTYVYTFIDDLGGRGTFRLTVDPAPPTTTTTTQPPTTTTTSTTTTTQPPTTTSTTTTTVPETTTTTTTVPETTTTQPPTTTTSTTTSTTTTTTVPPTTTTSTLVPSAIAAAGSGGGSSSNFPIFAVGGVVLFGLIGAGIIAIRALGSPNRAMSPSLAITHRRRSEQRKTEKRSTAPKSGSGLGEWWRGTALVVGYREWRGRRAAEKKLQRRIKERRRLDGT